jgi:prophage regulatory protein
MDDNFEPGRNRQILRLPAVMARTGMGRSWLYREIKAKRFVAPVKIGRASGWDAFAVDAWIEAQLAASKK